MSQQIFVNLPVTELERSVRFYNHLGFESNPQFTDDTAACIVISDAIYLMLLTHAKFSTFTPKTIADATETTEVLICLSRDGRAAVDDLVAKALAHGGKEYKDPEDYGFMYGHGFQDPDGHIIEVVYMDPAAFATEAA